jgi:hypothetical protein
MLKEGLLRLFGSLLNFGKISSYCSEGMILRLVKRGRCRLMGILSRALMIVYVILDCLRLGSNDLVLAFFGFLGNGGWKRALRSFLEMVSGKS